MNIWGKILVVCMVLCTGNLYGQEEPINQTDAKGRKQGKWIKKYDKSDVPKYIGQFKDDKPYGEFRYYYESGHIKSVMTFRKDAKTSYAILYYEDGKKMSFGKYVNQKKDSVWTHYDPTGWVSMREPYLADKLEGKVKVYYAPNKGKVEAIAQEFNYKAGIKSGEWKRYFESGAVMTSGTYKNGLLEGIVTHYAIDGKKEVTETYWKGRLTGPRIQYANNVETSRTYYKDDVKLEGKALEDYLKKEKEIREKHQPNNQKNPPKNAPKGK